MRFNEREILDSGNEISGTYPYQRGRSHWTSLSLNPSEDVKVILSRSRNALSLGQQLKKDLPHDMGEVKRANFLLHKLLLKYSINADKLARVTIYAKNRESIQHLAREIREKYPIVMDKDFYQDPKGGLYRDRHLVVEYNGSPVEIKIITREQARLQREANAYFKLKEPIPESFIKRSTEMAVN